MQRICQSKHEEKQMLSRRKHELAVLSEKEAPNQLLAQKHKRTTKDFLNNYCNYTLDFIWATTVTCDYH